MAPEIVIKQLRLTTANFENLKKVDIWALGMVMFNLVNPNLKYPFQLDLSKDIPTFEQLPDILQHQKHPSKSPKYSKQQGLIWSPVITIHEKCIDFNPDSRPTASQITDDFRKILSEENIENNDVEISSKLHERYVFKFKFYTKIFYYFRYTSLFAN